MILDKNIYIFILLAKLFFRLEDVFGLLRITVSPKTQEHHRQYQHFAVDFCLFSNFDQDAMVVCYLVLGSDFQLF